MPELDPLGFMLSFNNSANMISIIGDAGMGLKIIVWLTYLAVRGPADNYPGPEEPPVAAPAAVHHHSGWSEYLWNVTQDRIKFYYWRQNFS